MQRAACGTRHGWDVKPPICELCGRDFRAVWMESGGGGELLDFAGLRRSPQGMTGNPKGLGWFCRRHVEAAAALRHLPMEDALAKLRRRFRFALFLRGRGWR